MWACPGLSCGPAWAGGPWAGREDPPLMPWKGFLETVVRSELEGGPSLKEEGGVIQLDVDSSGAALSVPALEPEDCFWDARLGDGGDPAATGTDA